MNKILDAYADNSRWLNPLIVCLLFLAVSNRLAILFTQANIAMPSFVQVATNIVAAVAFASSALIAMMTDTVLARGYCYVGTIAALGGAFPLPDLVIKEFEI